jgi:hypothetical protein
MYNFKKLFIAGYRCMFNVRGVFRVRRKVPFKGVVFNRLIVYGKIPANHFHPNRLCLGKYKFLFIIKFYPL